MNENCCLTLFDVFCYNNWSDQGNFLRNFSKSVFSCFSQSVSKVMKRKPGFDIDKIFLWGVQEHLFYRGGAVTERKDPNFDDEKRRSGFTNEGFTSFHVSKNLMTLSFMHTFFGELFILGCFCLLLTQNF